MDEKDVVFETASIRDSIARAICWTVGHDDRPGTEEWNAEDPDGQTLVITRRVILCARCFKTLHNLSDLD